MFDFGLRMRELRVQHKLSQEQLGRRVGRSKSVICSYENNVKVPPLDVLTQIAVVLNVSLDYLVGIDKNEMVSVNGLSVSQKSLVEALVLDFKEKVPKTDGLTQRQQEILSGLMKEFSKR